MNIKHCAITVAVALGLAGAACGKKDAKEPGAIPSGPDAWVHYIPADSPLVVASLEPMPQGMVDWLAEGFGPLAATLQTKLSEELAQSSDEKERAILTELDGKLSRQGMAEIGVSLNPRFAVYSIGFSIAMRLELADGQRFRAFIERLEKASGESMERGALEGVEYLGGGDDEVSVVIAIPGNELIVGFMPTKARTDVLPLLLGVQRPDKSVADTGVLPKLIDKYELSGVSPGYFDTQALVRMLSGRGSAVSAATLAAAGADLSSVATPTCQKELDSLAEIAPRFVFGYTKIAPPRLETRGVLELRKDIARDLAGVQTPVHGLGDPLKDRRMFAFGVGVDLDKLLAWVGDKAKGVGASPYQCPALAELNSTMGEIDRNFGSLRASMPAFAAGFRGMTVVLQDLQVGGDTPTGSGYAAVGVAQPMALLDMVRGYIPEMASVQVKPGGAPTAVTTGMPGLDPMYLTVQGSWLGAAVGKGMADQMSAALRTEPASGGPFAVFAYDYGRFLSMMQSEMGDMDPEERQIVQALVQMFGFSVTRLRFEAHGLVATQVIEGR
ncbi:MAG TPA: hypothetical protein VNM90_01740 [Haliangium sp.]|nr:hypothetical protein [Haliangium sp.]